MCVHAHTGAAGPGQMRDAAAGGQRMALRIQRFGVDAPLDGEATLGSDTYLVTLVFDKTGDSWLISGINFSLK